MTKSWYLIYTRQNSEKDICALLRKKKIEIFCPYNRKKIKHLQKIKLIIEPLFASCIFARLSNEDFTVIKTYKNLMNVVFWKTNYAIIPNEEIKTIKEFVQHYQNIKIEKSNVESGDIIFTNYPNYTSNTNSLTIRADLINVQLPSIGITMTAEAEREKVFEKDHIISGNHLYLRLSDKMHRNINL